jgi:serine/threonine-protein kinase HipA
MDIYPADKYNVSVEEVLAAIKRATAAWPIAVQTALLLTAFSYVIGNGDHHAKNYSVVQTAAGDLRFSPAYDLLCTRVYGDPVMAISLNGKIDEWERADFDDLAGELGLNRRGFAAGLDRMLGKLEAEIPAVRDIPTEGTWAGQSEAMQDRLGSLKAG